MSSGSSGPKKKPVSGEIPSLESEEKSLHCFQCHHPLAEHHRALYVESEIGRVFCSEDCIIQYFAPEVEALEKDYLKNLPADDLSGSEKEALSNARWETLRNPEEVWREKTLSGDFRYAVIAAVNPERVKEVTGKVQEAWSVVITLFLDGEPSFMYLAFVTRSSSLLDTFRRGERLEWEAEEALDEGESSEPHFDGLASPWTENETFRATVGAARNPKDIPLEDFPLFEPCIEETLQSPNEVWSYEPEEANSRRIYHFVRHYDHEDPPFWFVVTARETDDPDQLEIVDAIPTNDSHYVDHFRKGVQEVGDRTETQVSVSRMVH